MSEPFEAQDELKLPPPEENPTLPDQVGVNAN